MRYNKKGSRFTRDFLSHLYPSVRHGARHSMRLGGSFQLLGASIS